MSEVTVNLDDVLALPDDKLREHLEGLRPKPDYPEHLLGRWAKHPEYGDVMCILDEPNKDGTMPVRWRDANAMCGTGWRIVPVSELTFPEQATRPEDVPVGEAWLVGVEDGNESSKRVVALKYGDSDWRTGAGVMTDMNWWMDKEVTLISPLTPGTPATQEPEFVETAEEYAALPEGSVVAANGCVACTKETDGYWHLTDPYGCRSDIEMTVGTRRRRVLRRGWGNE